VGSGNGEQAAAGGHEEGEMQMQMQGEEGGKGANLDVVDTDSWSMGASARQRKGMLGNHRVGGSGES
jgi:hypothetical protein